MNRKALVDHVHYLLRGGGAHLGLAEAIADLPARLRGTRPQGVPHSCWQILEHMRIAQEDILGFCRDPEHVSPKFPDGYWPPGEAPDETAWTGTVKSFHADLQAIEDLVADPATDLFAPIPGGDGQTILREALLAADHNAYHIGQLVSVRQSLGAWKAS